MAKTSKTKLKVLLVAHDAGGANVIFHWALRAQNRVSFYQYLEGPAIKVFGDAFSTNFEWEELDYVVSGTGWQSDFEIRAIQKSLNNGIPVVAYLDHWVNYLERFLLNNKIVLPSILWSADAVSKSLINDIEDFSSVPVRQIGNYYWSSVKRDVLKISCSDANSILIIHEPIRDPMVDQDDILFRLALFLDGLPESVAIVFRPHPSGLENFGHRQVRLIKQKRSVFMSVGPLEKDLANAQIVVGYLSMVLPMAAYLGIEARSFSRTPLPHFMDALGVKSIS